MPRTSQLELAKKKSPPLTTERSRSHLLSVFVCNLLDAVSHLGVGLHHLPDSKLRFVAKVGFVEGLIGRKLLAVSPEVHDLGGNILGPLLIFLGESGKRPRHRSNATLLLNGIG